MCTALAVALGFPVAAAVLACGSGTAPEGAGRAPVLGEPIAGLVAGEWNWVAFPDSSCGDGSPTGLGLNPGRGPDLVFFLDGGGICSSNLTCFVLHTATLGPFGLAEFQARTEALFGSVLDRTLTNNPFADATLVFIPYCTADVHGGDRVVTYQDGPGATVNHAGHANVAAYLKRIAATFVAPRRIVVTGSSAGGFGALVNYQTIRGYYPATEGSLVDDSGPPLESNGGPLIQAGFESWGIGDVLNPVCGVGVCQADLAKALSALVHAYPADRFALLSWSSDPVISAYYAVTLSEFTAELFQLTDEVIAPAGNARAFIAAGASHTLLGHPGAVSQNGIPLVDWLAAQLAGGTGWQTVRP